MLAIYINYLIKIYALLSNIHIGGEKSYFTKKNFYKIVKKIYLR